MAEKTLAKQRWEAVQEHRAEKNRMKKQEYLERKRQRNHKIISTKVYVKSDKKSSVGSVKRDAAGRDVYVWRNVNIITPPTVRTKSVYNARNDKYEQLRNVVYIPDTKNFTSTADLGFCGTR